MPHSEKICKIKELGFYFDPHEYCFILGNIALFISRKGRCNWYLKGLDESFTGSKRISLDNLLEFLSSNPSTHHERLKKTILFNLDLFT